MKDCIGGVILYDETIKQTSSKKNTIPELISDTGSLPGIKVDTGAKILAGSPDEKITEGLDGLRERLKEYYKLGAKFTKWRGVYNIVFKILSAFRSPGYCLSIWRSVRNRSNRKFEFN